MLKLEEKRGREEETEADRGEEEPRHQRMSELCISEKIFCRSCTGSENKAINCQKSELQKSRRRG